MTVRYLGPCMAFDGGEAHIGGTASWSYVWYAVAPKLAPKEGKEVTRESLRAAANERLDETKRLKIQEVGQQYAEARAAGKAPEILPAQKQKQKRSRRSSAEVQAARAKREAERAQAAILATPAWLADDPEMEAFMQQYRESEPI